MKKKTVLPKVLSFSAPDLREQREVLPARAALIAGDFRGCPWSLRWRGSGPAASPPPAGTPR